jgi:lipoprotein NlpI
MGPFRQGLIAVFFVATAVLLTRPAAADDFDTCYQKSKESDDVVIAACNRAITSGRYRGDKLSELFQGRGLRYYRKRDLDRAIQDYDQAIRLDPQNGNAILNRGNAYNRKGEYDRALKDFDAGIRLGGITDHGKIVAYSGRGTAYLRKGQYDRAIADCNEVIRLDPKDASAYDKRGDAFKAKGNLDQAIADYTQAISLDPKNSAYYRDRGFAYHTKGDNFRAVADFSDLTRLDPKDAYAALWLDITERRNNIPSHLSQSVKQLDMKVWPAPVLRLFLGEMTLTAVLAAADDKDPKTKQGQVCEANFYSGELALLQGVKDEAIRLFRLAANDCPKDFVEWGAANAELKALGITP